MRLKLPQNLPRFRLATLPTPLVPALRLRDSIGGPLVWVKRDDLIGFATAGNKARSLEFLVGAALAEGCDALVTGGGASSNFCAAAAAAAQVAGLDCHLVLYGTPPEDGERPHPNLAAARAAGAEICFTGRSDRGEIDRAVPARAAALAVAGHRPYPLPRGGATALGAVGYAHALVELAAQLHALGVDPGLIVIPTGSGGTQAGLVAAVAAAATVSGSAWRVLGATVSRPPDEIRATVATLAQECQSLLDRPPLRPGAVEIVDARGPGFGQASEAGERGRRLAFATEGMLLDPVYSAKAFAVVLQVINAGFDRPIVFWHTGGLPAALHHLSSEHQLSSEHHLSPERSAPCPM